MEKMQNIGEGKTDNTENTDKTVKKRCLVCNKKVGLVGGFTCRCGGLFCAKHRGENDHDCSYNFAGVQNEQLSQRLIRTRRSIWPSCY